jgi:hypothetical protein
MRFLLGMIVGAALTVGAAYLYDTRSTVDPQATAAAARPMVNWDVAAKNWQRATSRLQREWDKLAAK